MNIAKNRGIRCTIRVGFLALILSVQATNNVSAQQKKPDGAIASIVITKDDTTYKCGPKTHPLCISNRSTTQTITATLQLTYKDITNHRVSQKEIVFDKLTPGETRYMGCGGCTQMNGLEKCIEYKLLDAVYEAPDSVRVRDFMR